MNSDANTELNVRAGFIVFGAFRVSTFFHTVNIPSEVLLPATRSGVPRINNTSGENPELLRVPSFELGVVQNRPLALYASPIARKSAFLIFAFPVHPVS